MLGSRRPEQNADEGAAAAARRGCTALVPTTAQTPQAGPAAQRSRPDPSFVAQLIATAERLPQTRLQRRGAAAEALNAYAMPQRRPQQAGLRTRQIA